MNSLWGWGAKPDPKEVERLINPQPTSVKSGKLPEPFKMGNIFNVSLNDEEIEVLQTYHLARISSFVDKREYMAADAHQKRLDILQQLIKDARESNQGV